VGKNAAAELQKLSKIIGAQLALALNDSAVDEPLMPQLTESIEQFDHLLRLRAQSEALTFAEVRTLRDCLDEWLRDLQKVQQNCKAALKRGIRGDRARRSYLESSGDSAPN
jgi:hypothetical protein